jgi:LysM repeat protein
MDHDHSIDAAEMMAGVALPVASDLKPTKPVAPREFRKSHLVSSGDTLSKISNQNNTTIDKLCQLNGMRAGKTLDIGDSIRIR